MSRLVWKLAWTFVLVSILVLASRSSVDFVYGAF